MKRQFRFTTTLLKSLPANHPSSPSTELEYSDIEVVGLRCLSGKTGNKRFLLRYTFQGRKRSISIGLFPDIELNSARKIARHYKTQVAQGIDPKVDRDTQHSIPTLKEFFYTTYFPLAKKRKSSWRDDEIRFQHCHGLFNITLDQLTASNLLQLQLTLSESTHSRGVYAPATVNRVLALLKTILKLAERLLDIPNVGNRVSLLPENNIRTRYLSVDEVSNLITQSRNYKNIYHGSFIALLFLIGCRDSELRLRLWKEIDLDNQTLIVPKTKNGSRHIIYLSDLMIEVFRSIPRKGNNPYIFVGRKLNRPMGSPRDAFIKLKLLADISNPDEVVLHTARHTVGSLLVSEGVPLNQIQKILNHRDISSTQRYSKLSVERQRETSSFLSNLVTQSTSP